MYLYFSIFKTYILLCPNKGAEYCDDRICVSVCISVCVSVCLSVRKHISGNTLPSFPGFFVRVTYSGSILLWRLRDMLCTSGFMDDVILAHKPRQLNVAAQLVEA